MNDQKIETYIAEQLPLNDQKIALEFVEYLQKSKMEFVKDNGYWKEKIYYLIKYNKKYVCYIAINDFDEKGNRWTVWSDDMSSDWLAKFPIEEELKKLAWKYIDFCALCGSCGGGRHKMIFGEEFDDVCGCTFRIDNPDVDALRFMKKMVEIRKIEILNHAK